MTPDGVIDSDHQCLRYWVIALPWGVNYLAKFLRFFVILHDDVIKWKHSPRYWSFVRGIYRWPVDSPHKGQWREIWWLLACTNGWTNNGVAGDLRRHNVHVTSLLWRCSPHLIHSVHTAVIWAIISDLNRGLTTVGGARPSSKPWFWFVLGPHSALRNITISGLNCFFSHFYFDLRHRHRLRLRHDDVIKWKHFTRYYCHWSLVNSLTQSFDVFFDLRLNKRFSKQSWGWWFQTP